MSHPNQHYARAHRELANIAGMQLRVFYCCDWGAQEYTDPAFGRAIEWDVPLLEGFEYEYLPIARRPRSLSFLQLDNPLVRFKLSAFGPDVVQVFGYAHRTNWRV